MRILLDSNVWLAILATDGQCRRVWRKARDTSTICASSQILAEIEEKLRVKFGFTISPFSAWHLLKIPNSKPQTPENIQTSINKTARIV